MSLPAAMHARARSEWATCLQRYSDGAWRTPLFRDLILADARRLGPAGTLVFLDIGCGGGFDNDAGTQRALAAEAGRYVGVEPDARCALQPVFSEAHRCPFETAPIADDSIDLAFAVMMLEHCRDPLAFWERLHAILRPGGIFWGFTMDARHWFVAVSRLTEALRLKDAYLRALHGRPEEGGYERHKTYYRNNTPADLERFTARFRERDILNFRKVGQCDYYFPSRLRWVGRGLDRLAVKQDRPGMVLAVRVVK
ncbi:MAG: class I SAM-dependent methyltransferase [Candidatus Eisenbacteria bacterium]|uniref:Class I SAM-dependent methyltransferase n=1 Tax=Eiseniibacteriota bacterium TaxID=2212470 RepID=A0A938BR07_UNCEI|nr:class I SAM-dependent methyltransferase [Candidatus Eisenbacteria bacterium]